jgi:hypothetical protein
MRRIFRNIAVLYSATYGGVALLAWITYFSNLNSPREHFLPGIVLYFIGMPSTLLMDRLVIWFPVLLESTVKFLTLMTLCGLFQVVIVWCFAILLFPNKSTGSRDGGS